MSGAPKSTHGFSGTVGNTPLILLPTLSKLTGCEIFGKAEFLNPGGSVKDRAVMYMVTAAENEGRLKPGGTIVEATAGNTGVGLVLIANSRGYRSIFTVPEYVSPARIELLRRLGAEVRVQPKVALGHPEHFQTAAQALGESLPGAFWTNQFDNIANWRAHYEGTGPEIWEQTNGKIDAFITSAGTGGTVGGISCYLKERNAAVQCWAINPLGTGVRFWPTMKRAALTPISEDGKMRMETMSAEEKAKLPSSVLEGIGSARTYLPLSRAVLDDDQIAIEMGLYLLRREGIFVGPSSGLNVLGAVWLARRLGPGKRIVTILCDGGAAYLSTKYDEKWLAEKKISLRRTEAEEFLSAFSDSNILATLA